MHKYLFVWVALVLPAVMPAEDDATDSAQPRPLRTWSVSLQAGFASTFQLTLGGTFGEGHDFQNRLTAGLNNAFRDGDSLSVFGWSTTDMATSTPNWQAGAMYRYRVLHKPRHVLLLGGGMQRWLLPQVKTGAQDWLATGNLNYTTAVKRVPITVNQDSWSLLRSTLPRGSILYTQVYTQHSLLKREKLQLLARQGPIHTYSWGFYGANGNRVFRYNFALVAVWKGTSFEAALRPQFALQDKIPDNRYWSFLVTRQLTRPFPAF